MSRGGARNRSGPQADENSGRSDRRGFTLSALPPEGFDGEAPDFPLPLMSDRESHVWETLWTTPQACAWSLEPWRWSVVAMYVRTFVLAEDAEKPNAALLGQLHRFGDQVGLTPAGLKENGWKIAADNGETTTNQDFARTVVTDIKTRLGRGA